MKGKVEKMDRMHIIGLQSRVAALEASLAKQHDVNEKLMAWFIDGSPLSRPQPLIAALREALK